jgi:hypothetical protein
MIRKLLVAFGIAEVIAPKPIIDACERIGLKSPETARLRPRASLLARLEGAIVVWLLVRGRDRSPLASALLSGAGVLAVVRPDPLIGLCRSLAYENASELEHRQWVRPAARLLGVLYLLVVFLSGSEADSDRMGG